MLRVELQMSSAYHPQTDRQTKAVNITLECYLSSTKTTPFEIVYGQTPPQCVAYEAGECRVEAVDRTLVARNQAIQLLQFYLKRAQDRMKSMVDKHSCEEIVAYKLKLPSNAQVHSVFHVSRLKKCKTTKATMGSFPHCTDDGLIAVSLVLDRRMIKRKSKVAAIGIRAKGIKQQKNSCSTIIQENLRWMQKKRGSGHKRRRRATIIAISVGGQTTRLEKKKDQVSRRQTHKRRTPKQRKRGAANKQRSERKEKNYKGSTIEQKTQTWMPNWRRKDVELKDIRIGYNTNPVVNQEDDDLSRRKEL
ncbi:retrotransposable element Tf2 [Tanacetum coccineum]